MDYVVTNVGLNTEYGKASATKPATLYRGDMDGTGRPHLVETKSGLEGILPIQGRSCSPTAMPFLERRFPTFRALASADLLDIYTPGKLQAAQRFDANNFESGLLLNESTPAGVQFKWQPLPFLAQASPGYGIAAADLDGDSHCDVSSVGNNDTRQPETSLWRDTPDFLLRGNGTGALQFESHRRSVLVAPNDTKGLSLADVNQDGGPDPVAIENNGRLLTFLNQSQDDSFLAVTLKGPSGNPAGIGSCVRLVTRKASTYEAEI